MDNIVHPKCQICGRIRSYLGDYMMVDVGEVNHPAVVCSLRILNIGFLVFFPTNQNPCDECAKSKYEVLLRNQRIARVISWTNSQPKISWGSYRSLRSREVFRRGICGMPIYQNFRGVTELLIGSTFLVRFSNHGRIADTSLCFTIIGEDECGNKQIFGPEGYDCKPALFTTRQEAERYAKVCMKPAHTRFDKWQIVNVGEDKELVQLLISRV